MIPKVVTQQQNLLCRAPQNITSIALYVFRNIIHKHRRKTTGTHERVHHQSYQRRRQFSMRLKSHEQAVRHVILQNVHIHATFQQQIDFFHVQLVDFVHHVNRENAVDFQDIVLAQALSIGHVTGELHAFRDFQPIHATHLFPILAYFV